MKGYITSIGLFAVVLGIFIAAVTSLSTTSTVEGAATLNQALHRAAVQCYAIEGRYPASVDYLVENYGVQIDEDKYMVFYEGFASNLMPDITVNLR